MMLSGSRSVLTGEKVGNPLVDEPNQPERQSVTVPRCPAFEIDREDAALAVDRRQFADIGNCPFWLQTHSHSPCSMPEQERIEPAKLIKGNAVGSVIDGSVAPLRRTEEQLRLVSAVTRLPGATS